MTLNTKGNCTRYRYMFRYRKYRYRKYRYRRFRCVWILRCRYMYRYRLNWC